MPFYASDGSWDPQFICKQIWIVQGLWYLSLALLFVMAHAVFGIELGLNLFFSGHLMSPLAQKGTLVIIFCNALNTICGAVILMLVVKRVKKCLDFACTSHFIHLIICTVWDGFPSNWEWWLINTLSLVFMAVGGEFLCMRRELKDINVSDLLGKNEDEAKPLNAAEKV